MIIDAWQYIWTLDKETLGGERNYQVDYEVYDERARDPNSTVLDLYIGVA